MSSLIEEAINSSQFEGACTTTRDVAKTMAQQQRAPCDKNEQMIVNNYHALQAIADLKDELLTPDLTLHLYQFLMENTLNEPSKAGQLRVENDQI